jgi:hypothetical protein
MGTKRFLGETTVEQGIRHGDGEVTHKTAFNLSHLELSFVH